MNGKRCSSTDCVCSLTSLRIPFFRSSQVFFSFSGSVCNCIQTLELHNSPCPIQYHPLLYSPLRLPMFFRPKNIFVHNPVAHIQAEFSAGGVPGCKFGNFQIPGGFNRSDIAPGTETDNDNSLNIKSQLQILLSRNLLLCKDETNFEIETFNLMKDIYSDGFGNAFW